MNFEKKEENFMVENKKFIKIYCKYLKPVY